MALVIAWLVFPLVLGVLALGCGLLLERVSGQHLPGALVLPAGLAVIVVLGLFPTMSDTTAPLTTPLVVLAALAGLVLSPPWRRRPFDFGAVACAGAVFAAYAAPIVLSGQATFAGYVSQVDTGTWFGLTDRIMDHGRSLAGLPPSTYKHILSLYLPEGYPLGSFLPLGVGRKLVGQDPAWLFQPYLAFLAAMLALSLYTVSARLIPSPGLRALVAFIASQPALLFAFSLWAGIKELSGAWILALLAALALPLIRDGARGRAIVPFGVAAAATLALLSFAGAVWLWPLLAGALALAIVFRGDAVALAQTKGFLIVAVVLSLPSLAVIGDFAPLANDDVITGGDRGVLIHPLSWRQVFGIWPTGDFRTAPDHMLFTNLLVGLVIAAAVAGLVHAWRRRAWEFVLYSGGVSVACLVVAAIGSPWVDSKALAMASPAVLVAAMAGACVALGRVPRIALGLAAAAIAAGVLWSNVLAYHDATLAPRAQLRELEQIGDAIAGQGPTLLTDWEPYASRHFLRKADVRGEPTGFRSAHIDTDSSDINALLRFRTIVRRRSPVSSRPPFGYRLRRSGRYWEVWQRAPTNARVLAHVSAGDLASPVAKPPCSEVLSLEGLGSGRELATVEGPRPTAVDLPGTPVWSSTKQGAAVPDALRSGEVDGKVSLPASGLYHVWTSGSFHRRVELLVDGRRVGRATTELNLSTDYYLFVGSIRLAVGTHSVKLRYGDGGDLDPGTGGHAALAPRPHAQAVLDFGPLVLTRASPNPALTYVRPSRARSLCGRDVDWVEAIGP